MDRREKKTIAGEKDEIVIKGALNLLNESLAAFKCFDANIAKAEQEGNREKMLRAWHAKNQAARIYTSVWDILIQRGHIEFDNTTKTFHLVSKAAWPLHLAAYMPRSTPQIIAIADYQSRRRNKICSVDPF